MSLFCCRFGLFSLLTSPVSARWVCVFARRDRGLGYYPVISRCLAVNLALLQERAFVNDASGLVLTETVEFSRMLETRMLEKATERQSEVGITVVLSAVVLSCIKGLLC